MRLFFPPGKMKIVLLSIILCFFIASFYGCSKNNGGNISATGVIEGVEVRVSAQVGGKIARITFQEGDFVSLNDTLAEIEHQRLAYQLQGAEAVVKSAQAQLELLLNGARAEDIEQAENAVKQAEANLKQVREDLRRTRELFDSGSATKKQIDDLETALVIAESQYNSAEQALFKLQRFARPEEIAIAQANLENARAQYNSLAKNISDCYILAPIEGVVTAQPFEAGENIAHGGVIAVISDLSEVELMIYVTEKELGAVKIGQEVEVTIDSHPKRIFLGKVIYISQEAEFTPKNIQTKEERVKLMFGVKVKIDNAEGILKPGMPADARIKIIHEKGQ